MGAKLRAYSGRKEAVDMQGKNRENNGSYF